MDCNFQVIILRCPLRDTGRIDTSFRTIVRKFGVLVPGYYLQIPWY